MVADWRGLSANINSIDKNKVINSETKQASLYSQATFQKNSLNIFALKDLKTRSGQLTDCIEKDWMEWMFFSLEFLDGIICVILARQNACF